MSVCVCLESGVGEEGGSGCAHTTVSIREYKQVCPCHGAIGGQTSFPVFEVRLSDCGKHVS